MSAAHAFSLDPHSVARALGGEVSGGNIKAPGPGCAPMSRSLSIKLEPAARYGLVFFSHSGQDANECLDHILSRLGIQRTSTRPNLNRREYVYKDEYGTNYIRVARY